MGAGRHNCPALSAALAFVAGVVATEALPPSVLPVPATFVLLACSLVCQIALVRRRGRHLAPAQQPVGQSSRIIPLSLAPLIVCFCAGSARYACDRHDPTPLPDSLLRRPVRVSGWVADLQQTVDGRTRFLFRTEALRSAYQSRAMDVLMLVTLVATRVDSTALPLRHGTRVSLWGEVSRPSDERNPGEFSPRTYYDAIGIRYLVRVRGHSSVVVHGMGAGSWLQSRAIVPARDYIRGIVERTSHGEQGAVLLGLLLGERTSMSREVQEAFVTAGVAHVLAVSGSNVAVVAGVVLIVLKFLRVRGVARYGALAAALLFYMALTGAQPSVVRATVMALALLLARGLARKVAPFNALGAAALVILGMDARQFFDVGFQLSFGAVASILALCPRLNAGIALLAASGPVWRGAAAVLRLSAVSISATLGTVPLTALTFGRISIIGLAANLVVIPATGFSVILGLVTLAAGLLSEWLAQAYGALNDRVLQWTLELTRACARLPFASIDASRFTGIDALPYCAFLLLLFYWYPLRFGRGLIVLLITGLCAVVWPRPVALATHPGMLQITVLDVGQGDATLLELPDGGTVLLDAGPRTSTFDAGERVVVPFLKRRGITHLDLVVISHPHSDHIGGLPAVLRAVPASMIIDGGRTQGGFLQLPEGGRRRVDAVSSGACPMALGRNDTARVRLYVLSPQVLPERRDSVVQTPDEDNGSLVLKLCYGKVSVLFLGDAGAESEEDLVHRFGSFLRADLLKVAHHGSATSSCRALLEAVSPENGVISVGLHNQFGHPSVEVLGRLHELGVAIARTDEDGAVVFRTDGKVLRRIDWR